MEIVTPALSISPFSTAMVLLLFIIIVPKLWGIPTSSPYGSIPKVRNPRIQNVEYNRCIEPLPTLVVSIDKNQRVFIRNKATAPSCVRVDLQNAVSSYRKEYPLHRYISLNADRRVPMGNIYALIKIFRSLEIERVGFIVEPPRLPCQ